MSDAAPSTAVAPLRAPWGGDDAALAQELCALADARPADAAQEALARDLVAAIRAAPGLGGVEDLLHEFSLSTAEGLALMMLAEALLRIPDAATADLFIEDRLESADWEGHAPRSEASLVAAAIWALAVAARIVRADESPSVVLAAASRRIGAPALRVAARRAVRIVGDHFVAGETIEDALRHARKDAASRYAFDMLGEGARTQADAERYFDAYRAAIRAVAADGAQAGHSVSVKLSALHPRFEAISRERVLRELAPRLEALAREARDGGVALTVDAEEADRLELTLDVFAAVARSPALAGWDGLGVAVQAYQKRARAVIDCLGELAAATRRVIPTRLVKGAYWDGEIKRAQERGLDDFPVFTQKALTDLHYIACAERLLAQGGRLAPQ
ncbi:MAG TPA: proline dehydrogenase family protein, partial [Beijerinckiaceae bacterium]